MSATREQAMAACFLKLSAAWPFTLSTRRNAAPETLVHPGQTAFILVKEAEKIERRAVNIPAKVTLYLRALVYIDASDNPNAVPDSIINPIHDALDKALAPDSPNGCCTLGGLVFAAYISGEVFNAPGDRSGKGVASIPIEIILF